MTRSRLAAIVGVAESDLGVVGPDRTPLQLQAQAAKAALDEAGLTLRDVDGVFSAGGDAWSPTVAIAEYLGITPRWSDSTNIGVRPLDGGAYPTRMQDRSVRGHRAGEEELPEGMSRVLAAIEKDYPFVLGTPVGATS